MGTDGVIPPGTDFMRLNMNSLKDFIGNLDPFLKYLGTATIRGWLFNCSAYMVRKRSFILCQSKRHYQYVTRHPSYTPCHLRFPGNLPISQIPNISKYPGPIKTVSQSAQAAGDEAKE
jgi:hypothetical protein